MLNTYHFLNLHTGERKQALATSRNLAARSIGWDVQRGMPLPDGWVLDEIYEGPELIYKREG